MHESRKAFPPRRRALRRGATGLALALCCALAPDLARGAAGELDDGTPRGAVHAYLQAARDGDWEEAARYLDLRALAPARREEEGPRLARDLKTVLDRTLWIELGALSDDPEGHRDDGLPPRRDLVGTIRSARGPVDVLVERSPVAEGPPRWRIAAPTVAAIPALAEELGYGPLAEVLPAVFFEVRVLEVQLWQWIGLAVLVALAALVAWLAALVALPLGGVLARRVWPDLDRAALARHAGPIRLLLGVAVFSAGASALALAVPVHAFLAGIERALVLVGLAWILVRVTDGLARRAALGFAARGNAAAAAVVPLGRRTVTIAVWVLAGIAVLQTFNFTVTGVLAGLGVAGLAVALAAQKTVENLFGGVTLIADRPVRVGDFCRFGDRVGTVEEIGLRSTRVRTLDRTVVSIPNAEFSGMQLENFALRDRIWLSAKIGLRYETTPDQLRWVLVELKKLLLAHPKVHPDPARVRFTGFGAYSLDLEIFAYIVTADINEFHAVREDLLLRIMDVVAASGTGFAFPSQTIYAAGDGGLDPARSRAAEAEVRRWREERKLYLPAVPPEVAAELDDTLDYPPVGSATRG
jgi:MscS family membrane protein